MSVKSKVLFPDSLYARDPARWRFALLRDAAGFAVFWILACWLPFPWSLLAGVLCGGAIAALFVLGHDAAHGTYSTDAHRNARVAQLLLLPSLTPVPLWKLGHNRIHHGLTGLPADWIWHPASPADYKNMKPVERGWYWSGPPFAIPEPVSCTILIENCGFHGRHSSGVRQNDRRRETLCSSRGGSRRCSCFARTRPQHRTSAGYHGRIDRSDLS